MSDVHFRSVRFGVVNFEEFILGRKLSGIDFGVVDFGGINFNVVDFKVANVLALF